MKIAIHETAVRRGITPQFLGVNRYHKEKFNMPSKRGLYICYNEFVDVDGTRSKIRDFGEETCAIKGHNCDVPERCDTYSICFALDGDSQTFNDRQKETFLEILDDFPDAELSLHRLLQPNRTCPGKLITLEYLKGLRRETEDEEKRRLLKRYISLLDTLVGLYGRLVNLYKNEKLLNDFYGNNRKRAFNGIATYRGFNRK